LPQRRFAPREKEGGKGGTVSFDAKGDEEYERLSRRGGHSIRGKIGTKRGETELGFSLGKSREGTSSSLEGKK